MSAWEIFAYLGFYPVTGTSGKALCHKYLKGRVVRGLGRGGGLWHI